MYCAWLIIEINIRPKIEYNVLIVAKLYSFRDKLKLETATIISME